MDTQTTASGLPYLAYLSGLNFGQGQGMAGAQDPSLSGQPAAKGGEIGQGSAGLSLDQLQQLLAAQSGGDTSAAAGLGLGQSVTAPSFGQQTGGLTAGSFGQQGGQGLVAGAMGGAPQAATGAGSADPLAFLQKLLGLGSKAAAAGAQGGGGAAQTGTASPTGGEPGQINPAGYSLAGAGSPVSGSPEDLSQFFSGQFGGTNILQDPTLGPLLTQGLLTGSLTPSDLANFSSLGGDQLAGLRTALASGNVQSDLGGQLLGGNTSGFNLGGNTSLDTSLSGGAPTGSPFGAIGGGLAAGGGLLNILQGIQGGNVGQGVGGALSTVGGLSSLLKNSPELANLIGLGGIGGDALSAVGSGAGSLGGILSLILGAQSGNPSQIGSGLVSTLSAINALAGTEVGASLLSSLGLGATGAAAGTTAGGLLGAAAPALGAAGAWAGPVAGLAAIASDAAASAEEQNARKSGWWNNPIAGQLYSNATAGVGSDLKTLENIQAAGGLQGASTDQLSQLLPQYLNNLGPYFATAQGGVGPIRASDTLVGLMGRKGLGGTEQYTANENKAQQGLFDIVQELENRGLSYEQLGQLPGVSGNFVNQTMDMANPLSEYYAGNKAQYDAAAQPLIQSVQNTFRQTLDPQEAMHMAAQGLNPATFGYTQDAQGNWGISRVPTGANGDFATLQQGMLTPELLLQAAQGQQTGDNFKTGNVQSNLVTDMYGGPLWAALARMSPPGSNPFTQQIQQHFNPWADIGGFSGQQLGTSLQPLLQQMLLSGYGPGGAIGIGGEGSSSSPPGDAGVSGGGGGVM